MVKPTFLCIGVQKSGTSSLVKHLGENEDIYIHSKGELRFFDGETPINKKMVENYENKFLTTRRIVGEKSPGYCYLRYAIDRISVYNPNMKLILILREPTLRAYSQFNMHANEKNIQITKISNEEILDFFAFQQNVKLSDLKNRGHHAVIRGYYDEIIEYIFTKFKRENVYIGISEEIQNNKSKYYNEIFTFLGARNKFIPQNMDVNKGIYERPIPPFLQKYLYDIYKSHNEKLYTLLGRRIESWENYYESRGLKK